MKALFHNKKDKVRMHLERAVGEKLDQKRVMYLIHYGAFKIPVSKERWEAHHWRHRSIEYDCGEQP